MAADITQPPVQIGPISGADGQVSLLGGAASRSSAPGGPFSAPFKIGAALYALQVQSVGSAFIRCYKSTDQGLHWTEQDPGAAPGPLAFASEPLIMGATVSPAGVIYVGYYADSEPTTGLRFASFTPGSPTGSWATDALPTIIADLPVDNLGNALQVDFSLGFRSDGTAIVTYLQTDGTHWNTVYRIGPVGGPWGAATIVATEGGTAPPGTITFPNYIRPKVVVDAADNAHGFLLQKDLNPSPGPVDQETFYYFKVNAAGALVTTITAMESPRPGARSIATDPRIFNGDLLLPVMRGNPQVSPFEATIVLYTGSPVTAPAWSTTIFEPAFQTGNGLDAPIAVLFANGTTSIYMAWLYQTLDHSVIEIRRSINLGSGWGTNGVFYDLLTNPPNATPASDQFIEIFSGGQVASVGAAFSAIDPVLDEPIGFFLVPGAVPADGCRPAIDIGYPHEVHYPEVGAVKFDLFGVLRQNSGSAQIVFQGVRRMKGQVPRLPQYRARPKTFTYKMTVTIPTVAGAGADIIVRQQAKDYDFELYNILILVTNAAGIIASPLGADSYAALWIRDRNRIAISNLPVLDLFYDGSPRGPYGDGSIVPPLYYPKDTQIQIDFRSTIVDPAKAPATLFVYLIGKQYIPC